MKLRSIPLALIATGLFYSSSVNAIALTDSKYTDIAGSLDPALKQTVTSHLNELASTDSYNSVGLVIGNGYCSGTWLGSDNSHSYILTAAHCLAGSTSNEYTGQTVSFKLQDGTLIASGIATNYFHDYLNCGSDIAVAKIPKVVDPLDSTGNVIPQPFINTTLDGNELHSGVNFTGFGVFGTRSLGQLDWIGKRHGKGNFIGLYSNCLINRAVENTDSWAFASPGDSGSASWQERKGHPVAVGIASWWFGWYWGYSGHAAIGPHGDWLKSVVPVLKTVDDIPDEPVETQFVLTEKEPLLTDNIEKDIRGSAYYVKGANIVDGPNRYIWRYPRATTSFSVNLTHQESNVSYKVWLQGQRKTYCGWGKVNNSAWCYPRPDLGQLKLEFDQKDNPSLPIGTYTGDFSFIALSLYNRQFQQEIPIQANIVIDQELPADGEITESSPYLGERLDKETYGTVYYLAKEMIGVPRPIWSGRRGIYKRIHIELQNTETGAIERVALRGERNLGCGWSTMNNAAYCWRKGPNYGELRVSYVADDNLDLPIGAYSGVLNVTVKGLHNRSFQRQLLLNINIVKTE
ncbi:trypsin-like serine protease [Photobacterium damselae]|uniref:trypsin-like serine protease n=1 Tax=Photobacterium damselae TaxID=38293 RepID=UPI003C6DC34F